PLSFFVEGGGPACSLFYAGALETKFLVVGAERRVVVHAIEAKEVLSALGGEILSKLDQSCTDAFSCGDSRNRHAVNIACLAIGSTLAPRCFICPLHRKRCNGLMFTQRQVRFMIANALADNFSSAIRVHPSPHVN